jgi:hypothetical protein
MLRFINKRKGITMFYLYLKTHNNTGLKYLGYTKRDPNKYKGSGLYLKKHIREHGYHVTTDILFQSEDIDEISQKGLYYSELWNIVNDDMFANLCEEDGNRIRGKANMNFLGHKQTEDTRKKISVNNAKAHLGKFGNEHPAYRHKVNPKVFENCIHMIEKNKISGVWNKNKKGVQLHSNDTRNKMSKSASKEPKEIIECNICGKRGGKPAMVRFHFDNCKDKI